MLWLFTSLASAFFISVTPIPKNAIEQTIASHEISLKDRYNNPVVNRVFADNILLTLDYLQGAMHTAQPDWQIIEKPANYQLTLKPRETFAFHDMVLPQYQGKIGKTTNAHFNGAEGFLSDGYLTGDGVCHIASLMDWTAQDAGLEVNAPTNHDFYKIPEIPKQYGVAIFASPNDGNASALQNLYITNTKEKPVTFAFAYNGDTLKLSIRENH